MKSKADINKAAGVFIDGKGRLLLSRDKGTTKWQVLGGRLESGETHVECLIREIKEELDVEIEVEPKMYKAAPVFAAANDPGKTVQIFFYFAKILGKPKLIENVEELCWFTKKEIGSGSYEFSEATFKFLIPNLIKDQILK